MLYCKGIRKIMRLISDRIGSFMRQQEGMEGSMVEEQRYLISDAAKMVAVETHVLRYWEEELELSIGRTELGHRYYTRKNIQTFQNIKELKEKGLQLKAIKVILQRIEDKEGKSDTKQEQTDGKAGQTTEEEKASRGKEREMSEMPLAVLENNTEKLRQFESLVAGIVDRVIKENNEELQKALKENFAKEIDYLVKTQEIREEERFKKLDELIRMHQKQGKMAAATKENSLFKRLFERERKKR